MCLQLFDIAVVELCLVRNVGLEVVRSGTADKGLLADDCFLFDRYGKPVDKVLASLEDSRVLVVGGAMNMQPPQLLDQLPRFDELIVGVRSCLLGSLVMLVEQPAQLLVLTLTAHSAEVDVVNQYKTDRHPRIFELLFP